MKRYTKFAILFAALWMNPLSLWDEWAKSGAYLLQYLYGYAEAQADPTGWTAPASRGWDGSYLYSSICLGGAYSGGMSTHFGNTSEVRIFGSLVPGAQIELNFSGTIGVEFCDPQPTQDGVSWDATNKILTLTMDSAGRRNFFILGGSDGSTTANEGSTPAVTKRVRENGTGTWFAFNPALFHTFDLNNTGGVTVADLSVFSNDRFASVHRQRSDYNADGDVTVADLSIFSDARFGGEFTLSCGETSPALLTPTPSRSWGSVKATYR